MPGPNSRTRDESDPGPRLLLMNASRPALESLLATAWPICPAPMIPIVIISVSSQWASVSAALHAGLHRLCVVQELLFPLKARPNVARVVDQNLRHSRHRVGPGPVALQLSPEDAPRDRHHPRLHHALDRHLM